MAKIIHLPPELKFEMLGLSISEAGVSFDFAVIEYICRVNGMDEKSLASDSRALVALIGAWYHKERADGAPRSMVAERLLCGAEAEEDAFVVP